MSCIPSEAAMTRRVLLISLFALLLAVPASGSGSPADGFKGIYVGQREKDLPPGLTGSFLKSSGVHQGDYFDLSVMDGVVTRFHVVYFGETFDRTQIVRQMTLCQALKAHSLSKAGDPLLGYARGRDGTRWGLADLRHKLAYETALPDDPNSFVTRVAYLADDAPVFDYGRDDLVPAATSNALLTAAAASKDTASPVTVLEPMERFGRSSREEAVRQITEQVDVAIGHGKRAVSLAARAEYWLNVDEDSQDAKDTFRQLKRFDRDLADDVDRLQWMVRANKDKLKDGDWLLLEEPMDLKKTMERKMTQLKAMGLPEF